MVIKYSGQIISYENIKKTIKQMEKCICNIYLNSNFFTGFFCEIPFPNDLNGKIHLLITCNPFLDDISLLDKTDNIIINIGETKKILMNLKNRKKYLSIKYDTLIIEIKEEDGINNYLELDDYIIKYNYNNKNDLYENKGIHIIQYCLNELSISYGILSNIYDDKKYKFVHECGTDANSRGSPIINNSNNKIIGIHLGGLTISKKNFGTFLNFSVKEFIDIFYIKDVNKSKNNKNFINIDLIDKSDKKNSKIDKIDILDLSRGCLGNSDLNELSQNEFINLKELYLNNNLITNIKELEKVKFPKLKKLNLNHNKLLDLIPLENMYFKELKKLELFGNKISDIKPLEKAKLDKIEYLNLGSNKISNINSLQGVNFKELIYLNLFDNEISDIKVLENARFDGLQLLNLGANKISDINVFEKVNFNQLKALYLQLNEISNIEVFYKTKFEKLELLNLRENKINKYHKNELIEKFKSKIKFIEINNEEPFSSFPMYVGLILDVTKNILEQIIKFDNTKNFFEDFCSKFNGELLALINGNKNRTYYDINNLILSIIDYLSYENIVSIRNDNTITNQPKENMFNEESLLEIFDILECKQNLCDFINSKTLYQNIIKLKDLISKNYSAYIPNFFEHFDGLITKPSSITLLLKKILEKYKNNYLPNKYIIIITDGNSNQNAEEITELINEAKENNITIITYILSDNKNIDKKAIYNEFPNNLDKNLKNLFNISSKVDYKNPFARYYIRKKGYDSPENGQETLFFEADLDELDDSLMNLSNDLNEIKYEGIDIRIGDLNFENFIVYKYEFLTKNQIFGTCWSNAYSALAFLTNKRILGKKLDTFETYRENLIKYASSKNKDGGKIDNKKVQQFFIDNRLHSKQRSERKAKEAIKKGRFISYSFRLRDKQWDNFSNFLRNGKGILDEDILNQGCENDTSESSGHAVLLIEINDKYLRFLNSWGSNWGDAGTFKVKNASILKPINSNDPQENPKFYDLVFYEKELTNDEIIFYNKNIDYIRWLISDFCEMSIERIKNRMNNLYMNSFYCGSCARSVNRNQLKIYIEDGIYKKICPECKCSEIVEGELKILTILENLMNDGNEDFDVNFRERYNIHVGRVGLHENLEFSIENKSDNCSIGSENPLEKKIDSLFMNKVTSIINLKDGKFIACGSNMILVFELVSQIIGRKTKYSINNLIMRNILNEDLTSLCDLELGDTNLFASGGKNLKIYQINYQKLDLNLRFKFNNNQKINKIITLDSLNREVIKRIAVCDKNGYIGLYNIQNENRTNAIIISFAFRINHQNIHHFNCILNLQNGGTLVSSSQNSLNFWDISLNNLNLFKSFSDISMVESNDNLLEIKGQTLDTLLVGVKDGINIYKYYRNRTVGDITLSFCYKNEEFGGVFSMKSLNNNYFICGRSYGFCSIFLLRDSHIRKINIFRNNNQSIYDDHANIENDKYFINNIYVKSISNNFGYILVSPYDQTLKAYYYNNKNNVFID